jgi:nitroreductase
MPAMKDCVRSNSLIKKNNQRINTMILNNVSLLEDRATTSRFDADSSLEDATIRELVRLATLAPSAYHMQNWSFIAVRTDDAKAQLVNLAYGQRQVKDAAVTFIISGTLQAHRSLPERLQASVDAEIIPASIQSAWVDMASASHEGNSQLQRDEAIRSATFAAMSLLVAAREMGLDAGVVGGFDAEGLAEAFTLDSHELPVVLITVGRAISGNWPQKIRRPVSDVLRIC